MNRHTFRIRGMDCAEEVAALKATVSRLEGVTGLDFNLLKGTMSLNAPQGITPDMIRSAVREAGLEALPAEAGDAGETFWQRRGRAILCVASGALLLLGALLRSVPLYAAAAVAGAGFILPKAWASARRLRPDMNLLMTVAAVGAIGLGDWLEAASVTFLFSVALLLESWSVGRARRAIESLMNLSPVTARVVGPRDGDIEEKRVEDVDLDAIVVVRPGERIALDGVVTEGLTTVNQAPITGESAPVGKAAGDEVFAGTINNEGAIRLRVTKPANDTTLARIVRMVEEAQARRAPSEQWVEKFARYYTPAMMALAVLVAVVPPLFLGGGWARWFYQGLVMLVIACPCALVISTPVSIVAALAAAARAGVLIKGGAFLEIPSRLRAIALDKTGTLTRGHPEVQRIVPLNGHTEAELLATAAGLESSSEHPLARAVRRRAETNGVVPRPATGFRAIPGKGAEADIDGHRYWIGSHRLMHELGIEKEDAHAAAEALEDAGHSVIALGNDRHVCGLISVADGLRPQAAAAVAALRAAGIRSVVMLTGDNEGTAAAVARAAGVDRYESELLPEDKIRAVEELVRDYHHVAMVGDGVNDAPALAAATVGIAMGAAGTDAAIETADIALMSDDLTKLPWLIGHSRRTLAIVKQNIVFALATKLAFMGLAVAGMATLWMAIAADMGASLLVILNGLRLLKAEHSR
jgi:Zn2+/Cd2+-exporting ATPase